MNRRRPTAPCLAFLSLFGLLLASCAQDGGSSGTGITTVQGNVASARTATSSHPARTGATWIARLLDVLRIEKIVDAGTAVEGIRVTIEGTDLQSETDPNGVFSIHGNFAGPVRLLFQRSENSIEARIAINVPRGGTLTLSNVRIDDATRQASADSVTLAFEGVVVASSCPQSTLTLVSKRSPDDGNAYSVRLGSASVRDSRGNAVRCADLRGGEVLTVSGDVRSDGSVDATEAQQQTGGEGKSGEGTGGKAPSSRTPDGDGTTAAGGGDES